MISRFAALATAVLLAGCMAKGPAFTEVQRPSNKALIYIYRAPTYAFSAAAAGFDANEKRIAILDPGGYTFFYAPPGPYEIKQFWPPGFVSITSFMFETLKIKLDVQAGEIHYIRMSTATAPAYDGMTLQWQIQEVPPATGRMEIVQEKFQLQDKSMPEEFRP